HDSSPRAEGPCVAVNCGAVPRELMESELFGYEEGAFTGARRRGYRGKLAQADGGTLFLDEIGEIPHAMQVALLRVLQERKVTPIGSAEEIPVNVRVIAATHRNL
ncbi:sigma-54 factor interaction domain-containing protein, partial [Anoxybacillus sp. LAT_38]